jgi:hypothetical protein
VYIIFIHLGFKICSGENWFGAAHLFENEHHCGRAFYMLGRRGLFKSSIGTYPICFVEDMALLQELANFAASEKEYC